MSIPNVSSGAVEGTAAQLGVDRAGAGARLHCRPLGQVLTLPSGRLAQVLMMQTADQRHLDHLPTIR